MPETLLYMLGGIAGLIVILMIVAALRSPTFRIERSIEIAAPPERAFDQVNDLHAWRAWSPWDKMDPELKRTYSATAAGAGATYGWSGNGQVGEGRMTIEKSERPAHIGIRLEFVRPWVATNAVTFAFVPAGAGTRVTWAMDGKYNFMMKLVTLFMNMDKMVGGDFERGLAALKAVAEGAATAPSVTKS